MLNKELEFIISKIENIKDYNIRIQMDGFGEEPISINLLSRDELEKGQLGYRFDEEGNTLIGKEDGQWKENWFVIGYDEELGDPLIVDIAVKDYPIMIAMHGMGYWEPEIVFSSLKDFLECLS
ncbi:hypothetical protein [Bacillus rubiinfantis]|uniref:hypothetical protein n=1 Tax=Bacillus rubiinfantis TaxID=1499680 RepID=UPI0005A63FA1|nr:hypothetical protein [Bacillus rubiinfantis]